MMGESSDSSNRMTLAIEIQPSPTSYLPPICFDPSESYVEWTSHVISIGKIIELIAANLETLTLAMKW